MRKNINIPKKVDVAIIGSGMGGLISAIELSKHGLDVAIFEKRPIPGGYAHSFKRKGYTFDVSLHHLGGMDKGGMTYNILKPLNILPKLQLKKTETLFVSHLNGKSYTLPNNTDKLIEYLAEFFPEEKEQLKKLFEEITKIKFHVTGPILFNDFNVPIEELAYIKRKDTSFGEFLDTFIEDKDLKMILSQMWMYLGLPPHYSNTNYSACIFSSAFIESRYHVEGGGVSVTNAIVEAFEEFGGKCFCRSGVEEIIVEDGRTTGVKLEDGTFVEAKAVVSNASPYSTFFDLIPENKVSKIYRFRIKSMESSLSTYALYIGLDCLPSSLGIPETNFFYNEQSDFNKSYANCLDGNISETDWTLSCFASNDPDMVPEGCGILAFAEVTPPGKWFEYDKATYKIEKEKAKNILLQKYEKQFPGIIKHVKVIEFGTPRTVKRYSGNYEGAIYGFANKVKDAKSRGLGKKTPIKGLFLAGAWAQDGGGYEGSMMSGLQTAQFVLRELDIKRLPLRFIPKVKTIKNEKINLDIEGYKVFTYKAKVFPDDIGYTGKIKITTYLRFLDRARVQLINQSDEIKKLEPLFKDYFVNVYKLATNIFHLAEIDEELIIKTGFRRKTSHRAALDQLIMNSEGKVFLKAVTEIMFVKKDGGLIELPDVYKPHNVLPFTLDEPKLPKILFSNNEHFKYHTDFTIFYEDTDAQGIVYNVSYPKLIDKAFWNIRKDILKDTNVYKKFRTRRAELRFLKSATLREDLTVKAGYRPIDKYNFAIDYRICKKGTNIILADAYFEYFYVTK